MRSGGTFKYSPDRLKIENGQEVKSADQKTRTYRIPGSNDQFIQ